MEDTVLAFWRTVARSLVSKPACKMYPAQAPVFFERTRGRIEMDSSKCIVCTLCHTKCPAGAIVVDRKKNTWQMDRFRCILCGACTESCRSGALTMVNRYTGPVTGNRIESVTVTPPKRKKKPKTPPFAGKTAEAATPTDSLMIWSDQKRRSDTEKSRIRQNQLKDFSICF